MHRRTATLILLAACGDPDSATEEPSVTTTSAATSGPAPTSTSAATSTSTTAEPTTTSPSTSASTTTTDPTTGEPPFVCPPRPPDGGPVPPVPQRRAATWALLGPFNPDGTSGLDDDFLGGEADAGPQLGATVADHTWLYFDDRTYCRNQDDYQDLFTFYTDLRAGSPGGGTDGRVAYAGAYLWSPVAQAAVLRFGANDLARVWVGGAVVLEQTSAQQAARDQTTAPVQLVAGWNRVLVKVVNDRRLWGFYFNLTDPQGAPLVGTAWTPTDPRPGDPLEVVTPALPTAYQGQPYVQLTVADPYGKYPLDHPDASPLRLAARGGAAPYTWILEDLPPGFSHDPREGEVFGVAAGAGTSTVRVHVCDALGDHAERELELVVAPRPTAWLEAARLGGLQHGTAWGLDEAQYAAYFGGGCGFACYAQLVADQGYSWISPTLPAAFFVDAEGDLLLAGDATPYRDALAAAGVRMGLYVAFTDKLAKQNDQYVDPTYAGHVTVDGALVPGKHTGFLHRALEAMIIKYQPALLWLDAENLARPPELTNWEYDGLYSLVRTLAPAALIVKNSAFIEGTPAMGVDYELGDIDVVSAEGFNDPGKGAETYWGRWAPPQPLAHNPKYLPIDMWRYIHPADPAAQDWREWARVIVRAAGEIENYGQPRVVDLDHTPEPQLLAVHQALAAWLAPRRPAILGVDPHPSVPAAAWGYSVIRRDDARVFLHLLTFQTPDGVAKTGWSPDQGDLAVAPLTASAVRLFPSGDPVPFTANGDTLTLELGTLPAAAFDEVDTIVEITP
jgi:hypothetical protein